MSTQTPVRVFIGSGEASLLERKALIHSLRKHTRRELDLYVFNGTHNSIEHNDEPPVLAPMPLEIKYRNYTEFSLYRYLIPQLCGFSGRAIWLDSDMLCLGDIGELFDTPLDGFDFLAKADAYYVGGWGPSVMLIDCERCRFDLPAIYADIDAGQHTCADFTHFTRTFLDRHPYQLGKLDPRWNEFDRFDAQTRLIHYTCLHTQPWKFPRHPCGDLWFRYFREAVADGFISATDIEKSIDRAYVRRDIMEGNWPTPVWLRSDVLRRIIPAVRRRLARFHVLKPATPVVANNLNQPQTAH